MSLWRSCILYPGEPRSYILGRGFGGEPYILFVPCGRLSYNANDIKERYCSYCHRFVEDEWPVTAREPPASPRSDDPSAS